jgi:hypothetical protein
MLRRLSISAALFLLISISAHAQGRGDFFGGYSFERFGISPVRNLNGWELAGQYKFKSWLGVVADLDAHYGMPSQPDCRKITVMAGPQISMAGRISPFARVLAGFDHARTNQFRDTSIAWSAGGGIDYRLVADFSWRVIQVDEVFTRNFGGTQHSARFSTGIVWRF